LSAKQRELFLPLGVHPRPPNLRLAYGHTFFPRSLFERALFPIRIFLYSAKKAQGLAVARSLGPALAFFLKDSLAQTFQQLLPQSADHSLGPLLNSESASKKIAPSQFWSYFLIGQKISKHD
jgi:hypothetical protein